MAKSEKKSMKSEKHKEEETREQVEKVEEPIDNDVEDEAKDGDEEEVVEKTFEELGLDSRLIRALIKKGIQKPTPIQQTAIPYILEGKDVVARAKTGSGKTLAYLLPLLQKLFSDSGSKKKLAPAAFVLVPSRELCHQVYSEVSSLIELCRVQLKAVQLTSSMPASDMRNAVAGLPDILVSTPACIPKCFSAGAFQPTAVGDSLEILVLDEADLLLSYGYEDDLRALTSIIPRRCQCLLMSATTSSDVEKLKKLILHNPVTLTLQENKTKNEEPVPNNVQQFWVSCSAHDKLLNMLALLKLELVQKKVLMFTNTIDMGFRLKLFLEKFGIKSAILNAELPQNSRLHILEEFNAGLFDYLIATDDNQTKEKDQTNDENNKNNNKSRKRSKPKLDSEFGVVRGIDFKKVHTVIIFDMPRTVTGYIHRIGRTGRAYSSGSSISLVSPDEMEGFEEIKSFLSGDDKDTDVITPFPLLTENAIESLRYRAEDVAKSVTKIAVRESRAQDLRNEIINSEKLKSHFESNPRDLDLLKHDKVLSKQPAAPHLRDIPEYLVDPKTKEASKMVKLARAAMGNNDRASSRRGNKKRSRKGGDPLKSFNPNGPKTGKKESKGFANGGSKQKKHKAM